MTTTTPRSEQSPAEVGTLSLALDLGQIRWKLAFTTGFGQAPRTHTIPARDGLRLQMDARAGEGALWPAGERARLELLRSLP